MIKKLVNKILIIIIILMITFNFPVLLIKADTVLVSHEIEVNSFEELKTALANDNGITTIYLASDIEMKSSGIVVHPNKTKIIIDGISIYDDTKKMNTITDYNSSTQILTIYIGVNSKMEEVVIRNMNIIGKNYYGTVSVAESKASVDITYQNVNYIGPQITFNRRGTARYIDCNITINNQTPSTYHVFWFSNESGYFKVLENANIIINVSATDLLFITGTLSVDLIIEKKAVFKYSSPKGLLYADQKVRDIMIETDAKFYLETTTNQSIFPVIRLSGNLNVETNAIFHVKSNNKTGELIEFTNGSSSANFNNPKSVLLYTLNNKIFNWTINYGKLNIITNQLNYWKIPGNGDFEDIPNHSWKKKKAFELTASINNDGKINSLTSDENTITTATFDLINSKVLAFGNLNLEVDTLNQNTKTITGNTEVNAKVKAEYSDIVLNDVSNLEGKYSLGVINSLIDINKVKVSVNCYFLTKEIIVPIYDNEQIIFNIPPTMNFKTTVLSSTTQIIKRSEDDWSIEIISQESEWTLFAKVIKPFTTNDNKVLNQALIFVDENNDKYNLEFETMIATSNIKNNYITWNSDQGVLALVEPGSAYANKEYTAIIEWSLVIAP